MSTAIKVLTAIALFPLVLGAVIGQGLVALLDWVDRKKGDNE